MIFLGMTVKTVSVLTLPKFVSVLVELGQTSQVVVLLRSNNNSLARNHMFTCKAIRFLAKWMLVYQVCVNGIRDAHSKVMTSGCCSASAFVQSHLPQQHPSC